MRGYPPIQLFFLMLAFGAMAVPLARLTFAREKPIVAAVAKVEKETKHTPTQLRLRFAHPVKSLSLKLGDREMLSNTTAGTATFTSPLEVKQDLDIPAEGIEFIVSAEWSEGTPDTALTLELEPDGLDSKSETRWSSGNQMTEVISFQWK